MKADGSIIIDTKILDGGLQKGFETLKSEMSSIGITAEKVGEKLKLSFSGVDVSSNIQNAVEKIQVLEQKLATATSEFKAAMADGDDKGAESWMRKRISAYDQLESARRKLSSTLASEVKKEAAAEERASQKKIKAAEKEAAAKEKAQERQFAAATKGARLFNTRLRSIVSGALVFNSISAALRQLTSYFGDALKKNKEFSASSSKLRGALLTAFQPIYEFILPALISLMNILTQVITRIGQFIANISGKSYSQTSQNAKDLYDQANAIDSVGAAAKKAKKEVAGFDEINKLNPSTTSSGSSGSSDSAVPDFSPMEISPKLEKILGVATAIGTAILAWKISQGFIDALAVVKEIFSKIAGIGGGAGFLFIIGFLSDLNRFMEYIDDIRENGANLSNVSGAIAELAGMTGDLSILAGHTSVGGALKVVQGIGQIVSAVADMASNGINWDNVSTTVIGVSDLVIGAGAISKNWALVGAGFTLQGLVTVVDEVKNIINACKTGDWESVNWITLAIGGVEMVGGLIIAISKLKGAKQKLGVASEVGDALEATTQATETVSSGTGKVTSKMKELAKNIGFGILILVEVAVAAGLIVAAIWGIGVLLEQVGKAWQPVIDNAGTVSIAVVSGAVLLLAVGGACFGLGKIGGKIAADIGIGAAVLLELGAATALFIAEIWAIGWGLSKVIEAWQPVLDNYGATWAAIGTGTLLLVAIGAVCALLGVAAVGSGLLLPLAIGAGAAMLLELGAATLLFIAEIWAIGKGLDEVGNAWQPVLDNGDTISAGIEKGTELLIAIGVVTAALGVASVASVGLLPLAIGLGTKLLVDLGDAVVDFNNSLVKVAESLGNNLHPALRDLNGKLPILSDNMSNFTDFMSEFAGEIVSYSKDSTISGVATTIGKVIGFFTADPIQSLSDEVKKQTGKFEGLNDNLGKCIPDIETSIRLIERYNTLMDKFQATANTGQSKPSIITFLSDVVSGSWTAIKKTINTIIGGIEKMVNSVIRGINGMINALNKLSFTVPDWVPVIGGGKFGFNLRKVSDISIPRLAKGAVIPPNKEFLAVLGDQRHGTNIEAPLSTIQEAVALVMQDQTASILAGFEASVGVQREILEAVLGIQIGDDVIGNAMTRYTRKQAIIKGGLL